MSLRILALSLAVVLTMPAAAQAAFVANSSLRPDGSRIDWQLDRPDDGRAVGLVVLAQGSGCLPALRSGALQIARTAFSGYAALVVEN